MGRDGSALLSLVPCTASSSTSDAQCAAACVAGCSGCCFSHAATSQLAQSVQPPLHLTLLLPPLLSPTVEAFSRLYMSKHMGLPECTTTPDKASSQPAAPPPPPSPTCHACAAGAGAAWHMQHSRAHTCAFHSTPASVWHALAAGQAHRHHACLHLTPCLPRLHASRFAPTTRPRRPARLPTCSQPYNWRGPRPRGATQLLPAAVVKVCARVRADAGMQCTGGPSYRGAPRGPQGHEHSSRS